MRNEPLFLLAAALAHVAVLLVAPLVIRPDATLSESLRSTTRTLPIEVVEIPVEPFVEPPAPTAPPAPPSPDAKPGPEPRAVAPVVQPTGPVEPAPGPTVAPVAPTAPTGRAPDQYDTLPDDGHGVVAIPGVGGPAVWALPGALPDAPTPRAAPTVAPAARPVDKDIAGIVVRDAMRSNDKEKGFDLPGAGSVASAVRTAMQGSDVPNVSHGSFEVRLGPNGQVLGVRIAGFNGGGGDAWARLAQAVSAALAGRTFALNDAFAKGGTIYVDATSSMALPSGASSAVTHQGSGIGFDLSDIGSKPGRVVKTSFRTVAAR